MANIMDYLAWRGDMDFRKVPFNEVDNLILTQVIYLDFDNIVPGINSVEKITLAEAAARYFEKFTPEDMENLPFMMKNCPHLLKAMAESKRYAGCCLSKYVNDISTEEESQFSAMKVDLDDGSVFISFSGTDTTVIGWKENFNMTFLSETPGQAKAVQYVEMTVPFYKNKLRFGGHSKGGNLAVYAAMHASRSIQNRLIAIYNNDGPGFTEKMVSEEGYKRILSKVHTYMPQSSIVGMLLEHEEEIDVVKSSSWGIMQHDAFTWEVLGAEFIHLDELQKESILIDGTIKKWFHSLDEEQRRQFVDSLFSVFERAQIDDFNRLSKFNPTQIMNLVKVADELSPESKDVLRDTIKQLFNSWSDIAKKR